jgi:hypothetical protein
MVFFLVLSVGVVLVASAVLQFGGKRALSCWVLIPFPAIAVSFFIVALFRAPNLPKIVHSFQLINLACLAAPLTLSVLAALRPNWKWLFWTAWLLNSLLYAFFVFAFVFMKGFS